MMQSKTVVFPEANRFEVRELQLPAPGPRDIVVKTLVSAISPGTERWILRGKHVGTRFPCAPGYHRIGIVEECGNEVKTFQQGDIVYGSTGRWEGEVVSMWGGHVERSVGEFSGYRFVDSSVPRRIELETLAFAILAGVAHRGIRFLEVKSGERVLILGAGIIGICAAQLCALRGAQAVLLDIDADRISLVTQLGFPIFDSRARSTPKSLKEAAPAGFDALYDTVGDAATTDKVVRLTRRQGKLLLLAQYFDKRRCAIDLDEIKIRELTVKTICGIDDIDWLESARLIRARMLKIAPLITHRFEADEVLRGFELLHTGEPFNLGIVFRWDERVKD